MQSQRKEKEVIVNAAASLRCIFSVALFLVANVAFATGNFVTIQLPNRVSVELPRNWTAISNNQRITLDTYVQSKRELSGATDPSSDLNFAANYYDDHGKTAAIFNVRYYPGMDVTQADSRAASNSDTKELDEALKAEMVPAMRQFGMTILSWMGTKKQNINGIFAFVTEYRRASMNQGSLFRVRLVRVLNGGRSFTVTISYREDQEIFLRPICDRVIQSIRV